MNKKAYPNGNTERWRHLVQYFSREQLHVTSFVNNVSPIDAKIIIKELIPV